MPVSEPSETETLETTDTPAFVGFDRPLKSTPKLHLTTALTTDRENLCIAQGLCYNEKIKYPGVAELVPRLLWEQEIARSNRVTRTKSL